MSTVTLDGLIVGLDNLSGAVLKLRQERDEAVELLALLTAQLPDGCECDREQAEGRTESARCLPHRAEQFLESL